MFTVPFHFPFHRSIPYFSPAIRDTLALITMLATNARSNLPITTPPIYLHMSPPHLALAVSHPLPIYEYPRK